MHAPSEGGPGRGGLETRAFRSNPGGGGGRIGREAPTFGRHAQHLTGGETQQAPTHSPTDPHKRKYKRKKYSPSSQNHHPTLPTIGPPPPWGVPSEGGTHHFEKGRPPGERVRGTKKRPARDALGGQGCVGKGWGGRLPPLRATAVSSTPKTSSPGPPTRVLPTHTQPSRTVPTGPERRRAKPLANGCACIQIWRPRKRGGGAEFELSFWRGNGCIQLRRLAWRTPSTTTHPGAPGAHLLRICPTSHSEAYPPLETAQTGTGPPFQRNHP